MLRLLIRRTSTIKHVPFRSCHDIKAIWDIAQHQIEASKRLYGEVPDVITSQDMAAEAVTFIGKIASDQATVSNCLKPRASDTPESAIDPHVFW